MEAGRQLIRYILPGGFAVLMAVLLELVFEWAWKADNKPIISHIFDDPLTAAGGTVILGFVLYQLYYAFYRPSVAILPDNFALMKWLRQKWPHRWWCFTPWWVRYTSDVGGAVLRGLANLPDVAGPLEQALELQHGLAEYDWPTGIRRRDVSGRELYSDITTERINAVRSIVNLTSSTGDTQIKRSYAELGDIYHALGACRATIIAVGLAAVVYIPAVHSVQFGDHLVRCIGASAASLFVLLVAWHVIRINRRDSWRTMTAQLRNDLRMWALRNPKVFAALATCDSANGGTPVSQISAPMQSDTGVIITAPPPHE
jgi:hypothetical protein